MKVWDQLVNLPKVRRRGSISGVFEVREYEDHECTAENRFAPISHGWVNLYRDGQRVGFCGVNYAARYRV